MFYITESQKRNTILIIFSKKRRMVIVFLRSFFFLGREIDSFFIKLQMIYRRALLFLLFDPIFLSKSQCVSSQEIIVIETYMQAQLLTSTSPFIIYAAASATNQFTMSIAQSLITIWPPAPQKTASAPVVRPRCIRMWPA